MRSFSFRVQVQDSVVQLLETEGALAIPVALAEKQKAVRDSDFLTARYWDEVLRSLRRYIELEAAV